MKQASRYRTADLQSLAAHVLILCSALASCNSPRNPIVAYPQRGAEWGVPGDGKFGMRPYCNAGILPSLALRLRGGLWYSGSDTDSDYDDEDEDDDEQEAGAGVAPAEKELDEAHRPGWDDSNSEVIPLGSWNGGRYNEVFDERYA